MKMTERMSLASIQDDPEKLEFCVETLRKGGLVIFPTDTVYGIGARADNKAAIDRIFEVKRRDRERSLPVLLANPEDFEVYGVPNKMALALAQRYWPGPVTIIVPIKGSLAPNLSTTPALGFRCPNHALLRRIIRSLRIPVAGTSANISGEREAHSIGEIPQEMQDACDLVVDGGGLSGENPSTVVDCTHSSPHIVRRGAVDIALT